MPDGPQATTKKRKGTKAFIAGAIAATCFIMLSQFIIRELDALATIRGPGESVMWDHTMTKPPPDDFLFAMFPIHDGEIPGRVMLNTLKEVASDEGYKLVDASNEGHVVPRDELAFTTQTDALPRHVKAFNDAVRAWGDEYADFVIGIEAHATEDTLLMRLELRFDSGRLERYEYEVRDGQPIPMTCTKGAWRETIAW